MKFFSPAHQEKQISRQHVASKLTTAGTTATAATVAAATTTATLAAATTATSTAAEFGKIRLMFRCSRKNSEKSLRIFSRKTVRKYLTGIIGNNRSFSKIQIWNRIKSHVRVRDLISALTYRCKKLIVSYRK